MCEGIADLNLSEAWWREHCGSVLPQGSLKAAESDPKHTSKSKNKSQKEKVLDAQVNKTALNTSVKQCTTCRGQVTQDSQEILMYISCSCLRDRGCCCVKKEEEEKKKKVCKRWVSKLQKYSRDRCFF